jgi:hypothetical protein
VDAPPAAETKPEVKVLEDRQPTPAEQVQPAQPPKPQEAKAKRPGPRKSIAPRPEPKLIPPAEESLSVDAMARLKAFDGPPQAPFAFTPLPPFPPAAEAPMGVVVPSTEAEDAKRDLAYPVHAAEVTACILNLYLSVSQARFLPADWHGPARPEEPAGEPFRGAAMFPVLALSPDFPQYDFEPEEEAAAELAPALEVTVPTSAPLDALGPVESARPLEVAALAPAVDAALYVSPAVPASTSLEIFGPLESAAPSKPMIPAGPRPENPLPVPDRRVPYLTPPSFQQRDGGDSRLDLAHSLEVSLPAFGPALPSGSGLVTARELSAHAGFAPPPEWTPAWLKSQPVSGRDEFPLAPMRLLPAAVSPERTLSSWHNFSNGIGLAVVARDVSAPRVKPLGFRPAASNFEVRPGLTGLKGYAATPLVRGQGAVPRQILPALGPVSDAPHQQQAELPEIARALPGVARAQAPSIGQTALCPVAPRAARCFTPPSSAFTLEPAAALCPPALASRRDWQRLSTEGWNALTCPAASGAVEPWQAKENAPAVDRREPEPAACSTRLTPPRDFQANTEIQKGLKILNHPAAAFVPASESLGFWPEAMSRLAAALPSVVAANPPASVDKCAAYKGWEAKTVPVPVVPPAKFLPARGGAALPAAVEWPKLGAPPR